MIVSLARGMRGHDLISGGLDNDLINGDEDDDTLDGGAGSDWVLGGAGDDLLQGGSDDDWLYGDSRGMTWSWSGNLLTSGQLGGDLDPPGTTLAVIKDAAESEAGDDTLFGGDGNDHFFGGAGDDLVYGDAGTDVLQGEGGDDILFGGDGNDKLIGDSASDAVANDARILPGDYGNYIYYWRERHTGVDGNDFLDGGAGDDQMWGEGGDDQLLEGIGNDELYGGGYNSTPSGNDLLEGGDGNDLLFGEDGNDTLAGGTGTDQLQGGFGDDTYVFNLGDGPDTIFEDDGNDTIVFGEGILASQVGAQILDGNLLLRDGAGDTITVANWIDSAARVESVQFADGTTWTAQDILSLAGNTNNINVDPGPASDSPLGDAYVNTQYTIVGLAADMGGYRFSASTSASGSTLTPSWGDIRSGVGANPNLTVEHNVTYRWLTQRISKPHGMMKLAA